MKYAFRPNKRDWKSLEKQRRTNDFVMFKVTKCKECPNLKTFPTPGAGFALDWCCSIAKLKLITGYIEWPSEEPKSIPKWCPLR